MLSYCAPRTATCGEGPVAPPLSRPAGARWAAAGARHSHCCTGAIVTLLPDLARVHRARSLVPESVTLG